MSSYQSVAETAKLVRKALKESFPGIKFSVRSKSYSGGASINVSWVDGPSEASVKPIVQVFEGASFDGMIDYKGGKEHTINGETVHFGADFIFTKREKSDDLIMRSIKSLQSRYNDDQEITAEEYRKGSLWNVSPISNHDGSRHWSWQEIISRDLYKRTRVLPQRSKTAESVQLTRTY